LVKFIYIAIPIAIAIVLYLGYNYLRFGEPLETGYQFLVPSGQPLEVFLSYRLKDFGIFNSEYFLFNLFYLLVQGFNVEFGGQYLTTITGLDNRGTALLAASPFLFFLALTPVAGKNYKNISKAFSPRLIICGSLIIALMIIIMLFYHSNGFSQFNVQRYTLDWLPIAFIFLATALKSDHVPLFAVVVCYGILLNFVAISVLFLLL